MVFTLQLRQIEVQPGQHLTLREITWDNFEAILRDLGEHRATRVAYYQGCLEIKMPLPEHEKAKILIGEFVKILLDELGLDWEPYGSTTFKRREMAAGIEPDDCFYIQNAARMVGKQRVDLATDPPPDLAIEIDVTSTTQIDAYAALGVPELWRYSDGKLEIFVFQSGVYLPVETSPTFPNLPVLEGILEFLKIGATAGATAARRGFRQWLRSAIGG